MSWIADPGLGVCFEFSLAFNCDYLCHIIRCWFQFQVRAADLEFVLELFVFWFHMFWWYCRISWFQTGLFVPRFFRFACVSVSSSYVFVQVSLLGSSSFILIVPYPVCVMFSWLVPSLSSVCIYCLSRPFPFVIFSLKLCVFRGKFLRFCNKAAFEVYILSVEFCVLVLNPSATQQT